ncbi:MAG TPA: tetratricopeptide repeat protein [Gammaproteobacteria bacterium]|nr:tetratricopeptide repeat protein [Gammaproteobacteria bacterium]
MFGGQRAAEAQTIAAANDPTEQGATLDKLRQTRDALSAVTEYKAALHPAEEIVAELEGRRDADLANDLLHLATIQADLDDYDAAEVSYLRAIKLLEDQKGQYSPALIAPYHALGRAYNDAGRFDDALVALKQAQWLSKRNLGLYNTEQSALIDDMTTAYVQSGRMDDADGLQQGRLENAIRQFGAGAPELVPFYVHLADYYEGSGLLAYARDELKNGLEISKAHFGDASRESLELLGRLTSVELKLTHRKYARDELLAALRKATDDVDPATRGKSWAVLGDWAVVNGDQASASDYYSKAYDALRHSGDAGADADAFFSKPAMIDFDPPDDFYEPQGLRQWTWGTLEFVFDVSATGQASDVRVVSPNADDERIEDDYGHRILATHFRPKLEKGRPVASSDVSETYKVRKYVKD